MTVYYNTLICIRIRIYFLNMKYFVLNTSSNDITNKRKTVTPGFCCCQTSSTAVWGSRIFKPMLHIQMQVQVLPVATEATLVCRYVVKYHGEYFDFACVQMAHT